MMLLLFLQLVMMRQAPPNQPAGTGPPECPIKPDEPQGSERPQHFGCCMGQMVALHS